MDHGGPPVPSGFVCPISEDIMRDPVVCADGHTYDRPNIEQWFAAGHDTSPNTGGRLPHLNLVPNHALRNSRTPSRTSFETASAKLLALAFLSAAASVLARPKTCTRALSTALAVLQCCR